MRRLGKLGNALRNLGGLFHSPPLSDEDGNDPPELPGTRRRQPRRTVAQESVAPVASDNPHASNLVDESDDLSQGSVVSRRVFVNPQTDGFVAGGEWRRKAARNSTDLSASSSAVQVVLPQSPRSQPSLPSVTFNESAPPDPGELVTESDGEPFQPLEVSTAVIRDAEAAEDWEDAISVPAFFGGPVLEEMDEDDEEESMGEIDSPTLQPSAPPTTTVESPVSPYSSSPPVEFTSNDSMPDLLPALTPTTLAREPSPPAYFPSPSPSPDINPPSSVSLPSIRRPNIHELSSSPIPELVPATPLLFDPSSPLAPFVATSSTSTTNSNSPSKSKKKKKKRSLWHIV